jgi:hypothetical protein
VSQPVSATTLRAQSVGNYITSSKPSINLLRSILLSPACELPAVSGPDAACVGRQKPVL